VDFKTLKSYNLKQQLLFVESYLPDAWEYLHDTSGIKLPTFDDNDEVVSWGIPHYDANNNGSV
jgi:hypothetical protein